MSENSNIFAELIGLSLVVGLCFLPILGVMKLCDFTYDTIGWTASVVCPILLIIMLVRSD